MTSLVNYKDKNHASYGGNVTDGRSGMDFSIQFENQQIILTEIQLACQFFRLIITFNKVSDCRHMLNNYRAKPFSVNISSPYVLYILFPLILLTFPMEAVCELL